MLHYFHYFNKSAIRTLSPIFLYSFHFSFFWGKKMTKTYPKIKNTTAENP